MFTHSYYVHNNTSRFIAVIFRYKFPSIQQIIASLLDSAAQLFSISIGLVVVMCV